MPASIITTDDLREFKMELLEEIRILLTEQGQQRPKKWLKTNEVIKMLKISSSTLQTFRINGILPFTKIGGLIYYDSEEIEKLLEKNKVVNIYPDEL